MSASIALRSKQFRKFTSIKGLKTDSAIAATIGVDRGNLSRVLKGDQVPGPRFIAACLRAFPELDFADLFEVVGDPEDAAS